MSYYQKLGEKIIKNPELFIKETNSLGCWQRIKLPALVAAKEQTLCSGVLALMVATKKQTLRYIGKMANSKFCFSSCWTWSYLTSSCSKFCFPLCFTRFCPTTFSLVTLRLLEKTAAILPMLLLGSFLSCCAKYSLSCGNSN